MPQSNPTNPELAINPEIATDLEISTTAESAEIAVEDEDTSSATYFAEKKNKHSTPKNQAPSEKLQKTLARMGLGSRRQMEEVIKSGRVTVNTAPATIGDRIVAGDEIRIDGRIIKYKAEKEKRRRVIAYYKPEGEICSANDPEGRPTVFTRLPALTGDRWVMVGRLDINSTGLLLFTNDGELAHRLMHPSNQIVREYAVRVLGEFTPEIARNLTQGVMLEDGMANFEEVKEGGGDGVNKWYHVKLKEGRNREVRRLFESQGLRVSRLLRTRYGSVKLSKDLKTGRSIELDTKEIYPLIELVNLRPREEMGAHGATKRKNDRNKEKPQKARKPREDSRSRSTSREDSRSSKEFTRTPREDSRNSKEFTRTPREDSRNSKEFTRTPREDSRSSKEFTRTPREDSRSSKEDSRKPREDSRTRKPKEDSRTRKPKEDSRTRKPREDSRTRKPKEDSRNKRR